tara:strand:- start:172 stop:693 length:522 start_codon:yes stop_codon:yes gene_type:complete
MEIINKEDFNFDKFKEEILQGKVFVYPTDTIYGIGCDATNFEAVEKIRELKKREDNPFSVMVPSKEWVRLNCVAKFLDKLPGPYTLILEKRKDCVAENVSFSNTLGVRIPSNWFAKIVEKLNIPIVSTSVNLTGEEPMKDLEDLKLEVDFVIYDGKLEGKASEIISDEGIRRI